MLHAWAQQDITQPGWADAILSLVAVAVGYLARWLHKILDPKK